MGLSRTLGRYAWRKWVVDGVQASGPNEPDTIDIFPYIDQVDADNSSAVVRIGTLEESVEGLPGQLAAFDVRVTAAENIAATGIAWTTNIISGRATGNVVLASALENGDVLNGLTVAAGKHYFLPAQTTGATLTATLPDGTVITNSPENGIYTAVASGAASRATFADSAAELAHIGLLIQAGTVGTGERWTLPLAAADINLGVTGLGFAPEGIEPNYAAEVSTARGTYSTLGGRLDASDITAAVTVAERLATRLAYKDSGAAFLFNVSTPSALIKDAEIVTKRYSGLVAPRLTVVSSGGLTRFNKLGLLEAVAANTPRFDFDPITLAPRGLLIESLATNNCLQNRSLRITHQLTVTGGAGSFIDGETVTAAGGGTGVYRAGNSTSTIFALSGGSGTMTGTLTGGTSGATKTISSSALVWVATNMTAAQDQVGLDGVANSASSLTATATNATIAQAITLASASRAQSVWIKRLAGSGAVSMSMDGGSTYTALTLTTRWAQLSIPLQTLANPTVQFKLATSGDAVAVDVVQNEAGVNGVATSPILTTTAAVARSADAITMLKSALPGDFSTFSVYAVAMSYATNTFQRCLWAIDSNVLNTLTDHVFAQLSSIGGGQLFANVANVAQMNILGGVAVPNKTQRMMTSIAPSSAQICLDGALGTRDTSFSLPTTTHFRLGTGYNAGQILQGWIQELIIVPEATADVDLQAITNYGWPGNEPTINIAPNDSRIEDSDYYGTLTVGASEASLVRPIIGALGSANYEYATPNWRRHFNTRAQSLWLWFYNPGLNGGATNGIGAVFVDGTFYQNFTIPLSAGKTPVKVDFLSVADRHIEVVMPYAMSTRFLGVTIPAGATITAPATRLTLPRAVIIGDSRGHGFMSTGANTQWFEILCRAKGWQAINLGYGSRRLNGNTSDGTVLGQANPAVAFSIYDYNDRTDQVALTTFKNNYKTLINNFRALCPTIKLHVITSNRIAAAQDSLTLKIADYRTATADGLTELANANNVLIDGTTLFPTDPADGVHPNDAQSALWAANIAPLVSV